LAARAYCPGVSFSILNRWKQQQQKPMKISIRSMVLAAAVAVALPAALSKAQAAYIYGTITFKGSPPPEIDITPLKNDPTCGPLHKEMPTTHFYVVAPAGGFGDVVVSLQGAPGQSTGAKAKPLVIEQKGCEYIPYVSACQTGQKIVVKNLDPVLHNVHVTPRNPGNKELNQAQMPHGPDLTFTFNAPEEFLRFKCDVHPWMFAYVSVFAHPFYSVSDKAGEYRIRNVPPGHYTVVAMHRKAGTHQQTVDVKDHDVKLDFTFGPRAVS
jgi:plastocyanin